MYNVSRSFLRLGNPLSCTINDITIEELEKEASNVGPISDMDDQFFDAQTNLELDKQESNTCTDDLKAGSDNLKNKLDMNSDTELSNCVKKSTCDSEKGVKAETVGVNQKKYGGSLSLARIQSLVTMTTPRASNMSTVFGSPMFIEIDHSIDGFGCLFLPSVFPQQISLSQQMQGE